MRIPPEVISLPNPIKSNEETGGDRGGVVGVPVVVEPVVVPVPPAVVPVEVPDVQVAVRIAVSRENAVQYTARRLLFGLNRICDL